LAVVVGMKNSNDHAEPTKVERKKNKVILSALRHILVQEPTRELSIPITISIFLLTHIFPVSSL